MSNKHEESTPLAHAVPVTSYNELPPVAVAIQVPTAYSIAMPPIPSSVDVLTWSSGFFVRQKVNWAELLADGIAGEDFALQGNRYKIYWRPHDFNVKNPNDEQMKNLNTHVFDADEQSEFCERLCCKPWHSFKQRMVDVNTRAEVALFDRPFRCTCCFELFCAGCICSPQVLYVRDVQGGTFATVMQTRRNCSCSNWLDIYEGEMHVAESGGPRHILTLEKKCCQLGPNCCCRSVTIDVLAGERPGTKGGAVGRITNVWPGFNVRGCCTKVSNFEVVYRPELLLGHKLALLGGVFLAEYLYFEPRQHHKNESQGGAPSASAMER